MSRTLAWLLLPLLLPFPLYSQTVVVQSRFQVDLEGWALETGGQTVSWSAAEECGDEGGRLRFTDDQNPNDFVVAPPEYLGNWAELLGPSGTLRFKQRLYTTSVCASQPQRVRIEGSGGVAEWNGATLLREDRWVPVVVPLLESEWTILSGAWDPLLANVTSLQIAVDLVPEVCGPEETGLDNVQLVNGDSVFDRGDCNQDSQEDIGDAILVLGTLFSGTGLPNCPDACDVNDDGMIDIGDAIYLLGFFFSNGPEPPAPNFTWALDPTPDLLPCVGYEPAAPLLMDVTVSEGCLALPLIPAGFAMRGDIECTAADGPIPGSHPPLFANPRWQPDGCLYDEDLSTFMGLLQADDIAIPNTPGIPDLWYLVDHFGIPTCAFDLDDDGLITPADLCIMVYIVTSASQLDPDQAYPLLDLSDPTINDCVLDPSADWGDFGNLPCP